MAATKLEDRIRSAVNSGRFGANFTLVEFAPSTAEGEDQFASDVTFAQVRLARGAEKRNVHVVIKRQQQNAFFREMSHSNEQFHNEHLMYSETLPFVKRNSVVRDIFPEWYHSVATLGGNFEDDIVVVQDLKPLGYRLAADKVFLDLDHCVVALRALGRFHALSYATKQDNMAGFLERVGKLKYVRWGNDEDDNSKFLLNSLERGVLPLMEAGEHVPLLEKFQERIQDPVKLWEIFNTPDEPLAVLCHGDFNRNNMLFRYDADGKPEAVKFFDVATSRYASPAVDLSFFLFMNTSAALRAAHWDHLLHTYHDALSSAVAGTRVPSLDDLRQELKKKALYGYMISSFFIPMMMDPMDKDALDEFTQLSPEEMEELAKTRGGEEVTAILTAIVGDLINIGGLL